METICVTGLEGFYEDSQEVLVLVLVDVQVMVDVDDVEDVLYFSKSKAHLREYRIEPLFIDLLVVLQQELLRHFLEHILLFHFLPMVTLLFSPL